MTVRRREFITLLAGAAAAWPLAARAQQRPLPVIGYLSSGSRDALWREINSPSLQRGLAESGYVEGRNVTIEYRFSEGRNDRLPELADDLVRRQVAVIVTAGGTPAALAAKAATQTIPVVFSVGTDPVQIRLVPSLNRPGGNLTGFAQLVSAVIAKRLELIRELLPKAMTFALLTNPANPRVVEDETRELQIAARQFGVEVEILPASTGTEVAIAFTKLAERRTDGLIVSSDAGISSNRELIVGLAAHYAIPAIYQWHYYTEIGGLMSYGPDLSESSLVTGRYAGRILKGEKPADLPVQQADKIELVINLKTAKALGLTFPLSLLGRADRVIE
jgi:putative ABC transport system substrate-binding protein